MITEPDTAEPSTLVVRPARSLWLFLPARRRRAPLWVRYDGAASLGHVVQALGIPLTEVGPLVVDGREVTPEHHPRPGAAIEIHPLPRPQRLDPTSGFLLDVHLGTLARRLRLLGISAAYRNDADDNALVQRAAAERRVLLSQDRGLLMRRGPWTGAYVRGDRPSEQLTDVLDRFAPPLAPWTRCTTCDGELDPVPKETVVDRLEPGTRRSYDRFARCRSCEKVYWRGAHSRGLEAVIEAARARSKRTT